MYQKEKKSRKEKKGKENEKDKTEKNRKKKVNIIDRIVLDKFRLVKYLIYVFHHDVKYKSGLV